MKSERVKLRLEKDRLNNIHESESLYWCTNAHGNEPAAEDSIYNESLLKIILIQKWTSTHEMNFAKCKGEKAVMTELNL